MPACIKYRDGYKYQLAETVEIQTSIIPPANIVTKYIILTVDGILRVNESYAWDGPSGPTVDRASNMRGSLFHDAGYQLMREGYLDEATYRPQFDRLLRDIWIEDGMYHWLAVLEVEAVKKFAANAAMLGTDKPVLYAPSRC